MKITMVNKPFKFVVCMTKLVVGYWLHEKESFQISNLRSKYLTDILTECFRLHQVKVMKTDDDIPKVKHFLYKRIQI